MPHPVVRSACLDLDRPIDDLVVLRTIAGGEDLLVGLDVVGRSSSRLTCRVSGTLQQLHDSRLFMSLAVPLADLAAVRRTAERGVISALTCDGPLRFRIAPGTPDAGVLRIALATDFGWVEDASDWVVNFTTSVAGWEAEIGAFYWTRRFGRFERLPWSTKPVVAEILVRLAKVRPGQRVLDPFCGTGTLLVAAGHAARGVTLIGADHDPAAIDLARINLARFGVSGQLDVARADRIQQADRSVDRVVANLPFGKLVGSHSGNGRLYPAALQEVGRVLAVDGRAVLMTDDKRLFKDVVMRTVGLKVVRERLLSYGGVSPTVFVLTRNRAPGRGRAVDKIYTPCKCC